MPYFTVAHIVIAGKPDGKSVGLQLRPGIGLVQLVQMSGESGCNGIALLVFSKSYSIHDHQDDGTLAGNLPHFF